MIDIFEACPRISYKVDGNFFRFRIRKTVKNNRNWALRVWKFKLILETSKKSTILFFSYFTEHRSLYVIASPSDVHSNSSRKVRKHLDFFKVRYVIYAKNICLCNMHSYCNYNIWRDFARAYLR